ncbi:putative bifunctional diguanylate cyclase/phosphodiesterase [Agathobacter ruminis]|uniref:GGDEF domain-containing protein n=1 Tax=Agathobacter ruminis TaxID=1712665 RepID=A0A2G3E217_9FIRM|nr:GGDEF domain-containing phosphodiesterase [Agathobacter ruminis]MDC7301912.1 GGDEF domain-containing phosphodiesterase [Agathobacter ruminis]PHU37153.1 GGDEF domain-containing protein [Agathobacter ruminis]
MIINRLNQLYKPKRMLYYIEASGEDIQSFYKGMIPPAVEKYADCFGVYDYPGVFYVRHLQKEVIGIEFRCNDPRVDYPTELKSLELEESFFYSIEIDDDTEINLPFVRNIFEEIAGEDDAHRPYSDLSMEDAPEIIAVFHDYSKFRILHKWKLYNDRAIHVMKDEYDWFQKEELYKLAFTDHITGNYNWNHLEAFLEVPGDRKINDYAFAHFDIKQFRVINEAYGHIAANKVLSNIVKAMKESDFVYASARCHNDNFAMLLRDMPEQELKQKLQELFERNSVLEEDLCYKIYFKCGVVPMRRAMLLGNRVADAAKMAQALCTDKKGTEIVFYTDKMHDDLSWRNFIKAYVETAIEQDEFVVYLQPKFDIGTEKIKGAEALVRWNYKNKELLPPYRFIPYFEQDATIDKIDDLVLKKICETMCRWKREGKPLYPVSVNLSRMRMNDENLIDKLTDVVDSYGVDHQLIDFELTESASYDNMERMLFVLKKLRERGFKISMDDFGTGYSSLSLLTQMPIDTLKIDKSFVDKIAGDAKRNEDIILLRHIINLAKELGFVCLAEGAESRVQIDRLRDLGCEIIQGYYYSKPIPIAEYEETYL